jgi:predicted ATPase
VDIDLTLKNYRCFLDAHPARFRVRPGITAFVGVNNAGKSSLLKFFYEFRPLFGSLAQTGPTAGFLLSALIADPGVGLGLQGLSDPTEVYSNRTDRPLSVELHLHDAVSTAGGPSAVDHIVLTASKATNAYAGSIRMTDGTSFARTPGAGGPSWREPTSLNLPGGRQVSVQSLIEASRTLAQTLYVGAFRNALNVGATAEYYDISTGTAFVQAWRQYKTGPGKAASEAALRVTEDIRRIFEFETLEINASGDDQTLQIIVNRRPYMLQELGSGLAQFIIVLVNAAMGRPAYVLIDEPELGLHPSLQLDFLTTLASYASEGVIFATHSLGLAHAGADWVYSVRRHGEGESEVTPHEGTPRLPEFLGKLSFAGYRELGAAQVLLVEGRTEIKTFQQLLRLYRKAHTVVVVPLGGNTLISAEAGPALEGIKRLAPSVAAVVDSERDREDAPLAANRQAFIEACDRAGVRHHVLHRRAIEHYMSDAAVKAVKGPRHRALEPFEDRSTVSPMWSREENWRIARELSRGYVDSTDLGEFLSSL